MKTNVDILEEYGLLDDVRDSLIRHDEDGFESLPEDRQKEIDGKINRAPAKVVAGYWARYELGSPSYAHTIISLYDDLKEANNEQTNGEHD